MMARKKPLNVIEPINGEVTTSSISFEKPEAKSDCKMVDPDNVDELVNLLHTEAKVI